MNILDKLISGAAGYFGEQQKHDNAVELAKLGLQPVAAPTPSAAVVSATAAPSQLIAGVSNTVVFAAGAGLLALVVVVLVKK